MPSIPQMRKIILKALEEKILPDLSGREVQQALVGVPFEPGELPYWVNQEEPLADIHPDPVQMAWNWEGTSMQAGRYPFMGFVYEGTLDNRIGVTESQAKETIKLTGTKPSGITTLRLQAPAFICFEPFSPGHNGSSPFYDPQRSGGGASRILWIAVLDSNVSVHYCYSDIDHVFSSHSLQIHDPQFDHLAQLYIDEKKCEPDNKKSTQSLLFVMMNRLYRLLSSNNVRLGNSAWAMSRTDFPTDSIPSRDIELCRNAMSYVETCLHEELNREVVAKELNVSADHLGRVFRKVTGGSLMRYISARRVESSKMMLEQTDESINDIARLVGFASATSFNGVFKRAEKVSPAEYRRQRV
jgi:AraC-like DNA-binding protein